MQANTSPTQRVSSIYSTENIMKWKYVLVQFLGIKADFTKIFQNHKPSPNSKGSWTSRSSYASYSKIIGSITTQAQKMK